MDKALIVAVNLVRVGIPAECSQEEIAQGIIVLLAPNQSELCCIFERYALPRVILRVLAEVIRAIIEPMRNVEEGRGPIAQTFLGKGPRH